jgi:tetratricopeptide (TPR) repeat protein
MVFEKAKVVRAAEKYLAQGKIPAAIKEYEQLVANDHDDLTALNMLGDLYVRVDNKKEAIACFLRIAEHYRDTDFNLKAIAMYKKIDRLQPRDPEIAEKLGHLYSLQGLIVDARAQYLVVAEAHSKAGESRKGLDVLRKIADLDPENTDIRIKLAEGYLKQELGSEAAAAFVAAGEHLLTKGSSDLAVDAYARALEITPHDYPVLNGILAAHTARGTADEAAEILERAIADNPDEPRLHDLLARAYVAAEDAAGAERATAELVTRDPANYLRFVEVVHLYLRAGNLDAAVNVVGRILEQMLAARQEVQALELVNEALAGDPDHVAGLRLLVRVLWWLRDMEKLRAALERLLEAAQASELVEDERYALTQLTRLAPEQGDYLERLHELGGATEDSSAAPALDFRPAEEPVPTFESFPGSESQPVEAGPQPEVFEWNTVAAETPVDPSASFADIDPGGVIVDSSGTTIPTETATGDSQFQEIDFETVVAQELPGSPPAPAKKSEVDRKALLTQELESVDFYINQGYGDIALDTLELLERQFGPHPDIEIRRELVKRTPAPAATGLESQPQASTDTAGIADAGTTQIPPPVSVEAAPPTTTAPESKVDPGLAELMEEFRAAAEGEEPAPSENDFETHYTLGLAYKDMELHEEAVEEFQKAAGLVKAGDGTARYFQCCNMLGHCFSQKGLPGLAVMWFRKGLASPGRSEDEYQALRFDLGAAYEAMGHLDQAIEAFSEVYSVNISYRGVAERLQQLQAQKNGDKQETPAR